MDIYSEARKALKRIRSSVLETPVSFSEYLSRQSGVNVFLKNEHVQHTGSFKLRGATNKILSLSEEDRKNGVVTASTGNHGLAVGYAAREAGVGGKIFVPDNASDMKIEAIKMLGAEVETVAGDCLRAELTAKHAAGEKGKVYISPYNDPMVVAGQGTIGLELYEQIKDIDAVFIAVGGGGLISGIAGVLKHLKKDIQIVGCWAEKSPVMYECIKAGKIIEVPEKSTISDATMGQIEQGSITFEMCSRLIDSRVLVNEQEILDAMRLVAEEERWIIEGAAGVALAALLKEKSDYAGKNAVVILCGRNVSIDKFQKAISH